MYKERAEDMLLLEPVSQTHDLFLHLYAIQTLAHKERELLLLAWYRRYAKNRNVLLHI